MEDYRLRQTGEEVQEAIDLGASSYQQPDGGIPESDLTSAAQEKLNAGSTAYHKPAGGIPSSDMTSEVQTSLGKADSAYQKPTNGIPATDMTSGVQTSLGKADSAYQKPSGGIPESDLTSEAQMKLDAGGTAYQKPSGGIPKTDMASGVQTSLENADSAYQKPSGGIPKTDMTSGVQASLGKADSAYQKPTNGIPATDMASGVQTSLGKADSAYQKPSGGIPATDMTSGVQTILGNVATNAEAIATEKNRAEVVEGGLDVRLLFAERSFGKYSSTSTVTLVQAENGKYVNVGGTTSDASGYGISNSFSLNAGDILLVPSAQALPADVSVVARIVTRTFDKVIGYTYTYRQDYPELAATATADYDSSLVYTAVYDETGETPTLTGWTRGGTTYTQLPSTREVTESYYEPLVKQSVSAMPSTGYYIYLCPSAMTVVISGLTATVSGGECIIVGWGIFKNICSNFVGAPGQAVIAQAFAQMQSEIDGLKAQLKNLGETKAVCIDFEDLPKVCGDSLVIEGEGAPAVVPMFIGQRYHDTTNKKVYEAFAVTNSTANWTLLN